MTVPYIKKCVLIVLVILCEMCFTSFVIMSVCLFLCISLYYFFTHLHTASRRIKYFCIIMRPSSLGGGRILRRTLSVRLSVCLSVRPVIERHVAPPSELQ